MNRVYKVIWSKAKHCYVVTSEIAKSHTKGESTGRGLKKLAAALLVAAALMGPNFAWAADPTVKVTDTSGVEQIVYTKDSADVNFATKTDLDAKANVDKDGKVTAPSGQIGLVEITSTGAVSGVTDLTVSGNVEAGGNLKVGNGNFTVNGITGDVTTGYATIGDDLIVKGDTEMKGDLGVNGNIKTNRGFIQTGGGNINTQGGALRTNGGNINAGNGTITGNKLTDGVASLQNGNLTTTGNINTSGTVTGGTVASTGNISAVGDIHAGNAISGASASIQGALTAGSATITGDLNAGGAIQGKSISDGTATMKNGDITGVKNLSAETITTHGDLTVNGKLNMDEIDMTKVGIVGDNNVTASTRVAAGEITSYKKATSTKDGSEKESSFDYDENGTSTWAKATDADGKKNKSTLTVEGKGIKSIATDGKINASTNLSNKGFNTFASDGGKNKTYTKQTAESLTSQIGDDGKVQSVMNAEGISNNADGGTITNSAKDLVNTASENMTNTVGGNLTTTVTGDSSLTAENITNEAKNKITNKALDVETDAASSIVSKVSNDYGSNTSTQLSHQTKEEMSQADGKTASYLRGAAEEKSQLINGDKKTTIDTIAGQTNTNITEGKNVSNSLQKADQIASSVTDSTNTTVVNQDAKSLASSVTDGTNTTVVNQDARSLASAITDGTGTKVNNSFHWVDGSAQRIEVDDTHFYAETRTAETAVETLRSGKTQINIVKDTNTATVSSAVFDDATITDIRQNAKDISLSAAGGTITNDANDVLNKGANSVINEVGANQVAVTTKSVEAAYGLDTYTTWDDKGITSNTSGNMSNSATNITNKAEKKLSNSAVEIENSASKSITDKVGANVERTMTTKKISESVKGDDAKSNSFSKTAEKDINIITDGTNTSTLSQLADKVNTSLKNGTQSLNNTKTVTEDVTKVTDENTGAFSSSSQKADSITSTVKDTEKGTISERSQTVSQVQDKVGTTTVTTTDGLTKLTNEDGRHKTEMDYANVKKDLSVNGDAVVDQKLTVKGDSDLQGNATVGKNLEVNGTSTLTGDVTMESNATVGNNLTVNGTSTFNDAVTITQHGLAVTGGTTTDTLNVTGETRTGTLHVNGDGYVGGNLNVDGNIETHDAVLSADSRQVVTGRQLYQTNERVDRLDNRIKKVGANAAALAALRPGDFNPDDKFSIAAGFGSYRNANAAALGLFYRPNENVLLSLGTSFGDGENMVNAGVSVKFGRGKSMAERRKEMADEVSSMRDEMRSQDERIAELEEMLKKQSELIEKLSKES